MHDTIGSAGLLRDWAAMWTMQMVWLVTMMSVTVGATAMAELLFTGHTQRAQARLLQRAAVVGISRHERPLV